MATYDSPAAEADKVAAIATAAEAGILAERVLQAFDRLEAINGVSGPWTLGAFSANDIAIKELKAAFTGPSGADGAGVKGLGMYENQAEHLMAQMEVDDIGVIYSIA